MDKKLALLLSTVFFIAALVGLISYMIKRKIVMLVVGVIAGIIGYVFKVLSQC